MLAKTDKDSANQSLERLFNSLELHELDAKQEEEVLGGNIFNVVDDKLHTLKRWAWDENNNKGWTIGITILALSGIGIAIAYRELIGKKLSNAWNNINQGKHNEESTKYIYSRFGHQPFEITNHFDTVEEVLKIAKNNQAFYQEGKDFAQLDVVEFKHEGGVAYIGVSNSALKNTVGEIRYAVEDELKKNLSKPMLSKNFTSYKYKIYKDGHDEKIEEHTFIII